MINSFGHVGITVSNLENSIAFYCKYLGLKLLKISYLGPEVIHAFAQLYQLEKTALCKTAILQIPDGGALELFSFTPELPPEYVPWNRVGLTHIAFLTEFVLPIYEFMKKDSVELCDVLAARPDGGLRFFIRDPDGNLIEIMEPFR